MSAPAIVLKVRDGSRGAGRGIPAVARFSRRQPL
jgi:hypothetical protein